MNSFGDVCVIPLILEPHNPILERRNREYRADALKYFSACMMIFRSPTSPKTWKKGCYKTFANDIAT
jgi:hypothetical protein